MIVVGGCHKDWEYPIGFIPLVGAVNPSLTIIANALRVGDHLLARMG